MSVCHEHLRRPRPAALILSTDSFTSSLSPRVDVSAMLGSDGQDLFPMVQNQVVP